MNLEGMSLRDKTIREIKALLTMSGIPHNRVWILQNRYWPESYLQAREDSPWLLVRTPYGMIEIGWRKRVISINWSDTKFRLVITEDDVTKDTESVHAWGYPKALEYLSRLTILLGNMEKSA